MKGKPKIEEINYPVLLPSTWLRYLLTSCPEVILGGHDIQEQQAWTTMFGNFWEHFNKSMPGIEMNGLDPEFCIPIAIHGDEGRGHTRKPIMVLAWQPLVSYLGPAVTNTSGTPVCFP